jgi:hypothetical protein
MKIRASIEVVVVKSLKYGGERFAEERFARERQDKAAKSLAVSGLLVVLSVRCRGVVVVLLLVLRWSG